MELLKDLKKFVETTDFSEEKLGASFAPQSEEHYKMISENMKGKNNPVHIKGPWNKGLSVLHRGPQSEEERKNTAKRMKKNNPNADGRATAREMIVEMASGEILVFKKKIEAIRKVEELTGEIQNGSQIWRCMKQNKPYKGNMWRYKDACAI